MGKVFLYNHGGSANHGCEALVRTVCTLLQKQKKLYLMSESPQQDIHYDIHEIVDIEPAIQARSKLSLDFIKAYIYLKRTGDYFPMDVLPYLKSIKKLQAGDVEISVGGDIYCYEDYPKFIKLHELIWKRGCKSVLLGCSLEEKLFSDNTFIEGMKRYDYISARESLTYQMLKDKGFTNIGLSPDSAFTLPSEQLPLPNGFIEGNTIGLNVSPLVEKKEQSPGIVLLNYQILISWILEHTDSSIALVPHVVWKDNDDRTVLKRLYEKFQDTERVILIPDCNCMQLKGYISRCRMFVGARTHATIAAYSTCVPTLVLGYSIKSRGIAKDLFGTDEKYVVSVETLKEGEDLTEAFKWLCKNENVVRERLNSVITQYIKQIDNLKDNIQDALGCVI